MHQVNNQKVTSTKLVLLDLDGTLFDTDSFRTIISKNLANLAGVEIERMVEIDSLYSQHVDLGAKFDPNLYCEFIADTLNMTPYMLLQEFTYNREPYVQSLFSDVLTTLGLLKKKGILLGIFSEGNVNFQRLKIDYSGLAMFINPKNIYIYENKLDNTLTTNLPTHSVIVDDKMNVIDELIRKNQEVIWINRKTNDKHSSANTITSLLELNKILRTDKLIYSK